MTDILISATIKPISNQPKDFVSNSFALQVPPGAPMTPIFTALTRFYDEVTPANASPLSAFMAPSIDREAVDGIRLRAYNLTGRLMGAKKGQPETYIGSPFAEWNHNIMYGANSNVSLPSECAVVLTMRATDWQNQPVEAPDGNDLNPGVDRLRSRYTGRIYLGPLNSAAASTDANGTARVHSNLTAVIISAADRLCEELDAEGASLCVWSRADEALRVLSDVSVDNEFDTQRRRGVKATAKTTASVVL